MLPNLPAPHIVVRDFLSADDHAELLDWTLRNEENFAAVKLADGTVDLAKKFLLKLYDLGPLTAMLRARVRAEYKPWIEALKISTFELDNLELHIAAHPDGAHFPFHLDASIAQRTDTSTRAITGVYYFHREPRRFTGGDIRLYDIGAGPGEGEDDSAARRVAIPPTQNTLLLFPSWVGHDVTPVTVSTRDFADSRFAVNIWLHRKSTGASALPRRDLPQREKLSA